jgi:O-antigen/teichoic acid export membrane protein
MNIFIQIIPFIELLLILAMMGLGSFGYFSLREKANQPSQNQYRSIERWVLPGLIGLAILAIILLFMASFVEG